MATKKTSSTSTEQTSAAATTTTSATTTKSAVSVLEKAGQAAIKKLGVDVVYVTSDGQVFKREMYAKAHAQNLADKTVTTVKA